MAVNIKYVGAKPQGVRDQVAGTGILWAHGETRPVPDWAVPTLLLHPTIWARAEGATDPVSDADIVPPKPDPREETEVNEAIHDLQIGAMDKDALEQYAKRHFSVDLDKRRSVISLRNQVKTLVAQFGVA